MELQEQEKLISLSVDRLVAPSPPAEDFGEDTKNSSLASNQHTAEQTNECTTFPKDMIPFAESSLEHPHKYLNAVGKVSNLKAGSISLLQYSLRHSDNVSEKPHVA